MKIINICWQNFKGLQDGEIHADGSDVIVRGKNGVGKSSIADILPFVLTGKVSGSVKAYDNGIAPTNDGLIHAAQISFEDGSTLRRELFWDKNCNSQKLYVNGNNVKLAQFNAHVQSLTNGGGSSLFFPFFFCELKPSEQRNFLLQQFGTNSDDDIFNLPDFKDAQNIFDGLSPDLFKERTLLDLRRAKSEASYIPARIDELIKQRSCLPADINAEKLRLNSELDKAQAELDSLQSNDATNLKSEYNSVIRQISATKRIKEQLERNLLSTKASLKNLREQYRQVAKAPNGKCPTCGQVMPQDLFNAKRDDKLVAICEEGQRLNNDLSNLENDLHNVSAEIDKLALRADQLNKQIQAQAANDDQRAERLLILKNLLPELRYQLGTLDKAADIQLRIDELTSQGKVLGKKITTLEGHVKLAERFLQKKIELLEGHINSQFHFVNFKLFDFLITTGEIKPTCVPMLNGVPYNSLSSGEKLKCALDILNTFQILYGVQMPLFIDNAEAYTLNSLIDLPNQKFLFKVSDEPKLTIDIQRKETTHS